MWLYAALQSQPLPAPVRSASRRSRASTEGPQAAGRHARRIPRLGDAAVFSIDAERIDAATLALVRDLTRVDELLFAEALSSFVARARRVENATGVALLCDLDDPPASGA